MNHIKPLKKYHDQLKEEKISSLNIFAKTKNELQESINSFIDNESVDLNDRIEVFQKACKLGIYPIKQWVELFDGVNWEEKTLYDDFNCEKHATFSFGYLVKHYVDYSEEETNELFEDIEASIKYFFKKRMAGFINDW